MIWILCLALAAPIPLTDAALDDPLTDLQPLGEVLSDRQVVYLGESTHDDGGATTARLRLVRYLHEELGFDTILYEASRAACASANDQFLAGSSADDALPECAWGFWSRTEQVAPLRTYLDAQRDAGSPLQIAGMDPQNFSGDGEALVARVAKQLEQPWSDEVVAMAEKIAVGGYQAEAQERFGGPPTKWLKKVKKIAPKKDAQAAFRAAMTEALRTLSGDEKALVGDWLALSAIWDGDLGAYNNARDRRMAENLLARADEKLIVWGATNHGAHDVGQLDASWAEFPKVGDAVHDALGDRYYVVAVSAIGGEIGGLYSPSARPVSERHPDSIEVKTGRHAFVELDEGPVITEVFGKHLEGDWSSVIDAVLVIPETEPIRWEASEQ